MDENKKRFVHIVQQLRELIVQQNIKPGDKLPSERVLTERLQVGRSSVREALRSLELLGLIETKHGGGTFLAESQQHKLVDVVGSFILQSDQSLKELHIIRQLHEKEAIRAICSNKQLHIKTIWESFFNRVELGEKIDRVEILREIIVLSENRLSLKMWLQIAAYCYTDLKVQVTVEEKPVLLMLIKAIEMKYYDEALEAYNNWVQFFTPGDTIKK